jgi:ABC-type antimicrobial peptide transport system permease subunit
MNLLATGIRVRADLRASWRGWAAVMAITALVGGIALTAAAGARRTMSAYSRMLQASHASDVVISPQNTGLPSYYSALGRRPEVATLASMAAVYAIPVHQSKPIAIDMGSAPSFGLTLERPKLISGRLFDPRRRDEVVASRGLAMSLHIKPGDELSLMAVRTSPAGVDFAHAIPLHLRVVGIAVTRDEVVPANVLVSQISTLIGTPALLGQFDPSFFAFDGAYVRLRPGVSRSAFSTDAQTLAQGFPEVGGQVFVADEHVQAATVEQAIRPEAVSLALFALLAALLGSFVVGQMTSRQLLLTSTENSFLHALGMTGRQLFAIGMTEAVLTLAVGTVIASGWAALLSRLMPIGPARLAEPHPGVMFDWLVLVGGALVFLAVLVVRAAWSAKRITTGSRLRLQPPIERSARGIGAAGSRGPVSVAVGLRFAVDPGQGRAAVPVLSTLAGLVVAVAALVGSLTFGTNLVRFVRTPKLYGQSWDIGVDSGFGQMSTGPLRTFLASQTAVDGWAFGDHGTLMVAGHAVPTVGMAAGRGPTIWPRIVEGRAPSGQDEIVLGDSTLRAVHARVGQTVAATFLPSDHGVTRGDHPVQVRLRVVGRAVFPLFGMGDFTPTGLGTGAAVVDPEPSPDGFNFVVATFRPGTSRTRAVANFSSGLGRSGACPGDQPCSATTTLRPLEVVNYSRIQHVPVVLAALLAVLAMASMAQFAVISLRRRRRDLATLKAVGFTRRQVFAVVASQSTAVVSVALLIGVPLGVAAGRSTWQIFVARLGAEPTTVVPLAAVLLTVPVVVITANLIAAGPAWAAAHLHPATVLRTE